MRQQIQVRKLIKNSTVYLCEKVKLTVSQPAYIMMKQVRKPFIVGTNYQCSINTGTLVSYLISSCGNNHSSNLFIKYSFYGQIIHV